MARKSGARYESHDFYCLNCGHRGIPLMRRDGLQRERNHRKILYCPYCGQIVNHVECKSIEQVEEFKSKFLNGDFKEEAESSIKFAKETLNGGA